MTDQTSDTMIDLSDSEVRNEQEYEEKIEELIHKAKEDQGDRIITIHFIGPQYTIFSIRKPIESASNLLRRHFDKYRDADVGTIRIYFLKKPDGDAWETLHAKIAGIAKDEIALKSVLYSIRRHNPPTYQSMIARGLEYLAKAYHLAMQDKSEEASEILSSYTRILSDRRDSYNRMKFLWANLVSVLFIIFVWLVIRNYEWAKGFDLTASFAEPAPDGTIQPDTAIQFHVADVLVLGAIGAFFSVQSKVRELSISHSITLQEMIYTGFVRVPVGLIAAGVVIILVLGDWILGNLAVENQLYSLYLFGFIAGFSEQFVPMALKSIEQGNRPESGEEPPE